MTPAERALLLAVAEVVRGQYIGHPSKYNAMTALIAAVEAEADKPSEPVEYRSCETCRFNDDEKCAAPLDEMCLPPSMGLWQPRHPDRDDDISRVYEEAKAETCPVCKGTGMTVFNACQDMCWVCDGTGEKK